MADAFTAGVKPGGLNSSIEIRILLCYLIQMAGPLTRDAMQGALLQEELVNYFEFVDALNEIEKQGLATSGSDGYAITEKGVVVADTLAEDLPRSVRESAIRAVIRIQSWVHRAAQNHATIRKVNDGFLVDCTIQEPAQSADGNLFHLSLTMPDELTAEIVQTHFIARGSAIYHHLLTELSEKASPDDVPPDALL